VADFLSLNSLKKNQSACSRCLATLSCTVETHVLFALKFFDLLGAAGGKAFAAQYGSSARRLERHVVGFAALVTSDFKTLAFTATAACAPSTASAEIGAAAITASLATLRLAQVSFRVIFLLTFGERKRRVALGASDLYVWHC
jgi:hypothetical protein